MNIRGSARTFRSHENVFRTDAETHRGAHGAAKIHAVTGKYAPRQVSAGGASPARAPLPAGRYK